MGEGSRTGWQWAFLVVGVCVRARVSAERGLVLWAELSQRRRGKSKGL